MTPRSAAITSDADRDGRHDPDDRPAATETSMPVFDSARLLQGGREILIRHGDECYRLRHTRNDKLILTK